MARQRRAWSNFYDQDGIGGTRKSPVPPSLTDQLGGPGVAIVAGWAEMAGMTVEEYEAHQAADPERRRLEREELASRTYPDGHVVYYIGFCCRIKIGVTTNLRNRLSGLPYDELLATEPGEEALESARHYQFKSARVMGEWFETSDELMAHIVRLRGGKPWQDHH